MTFYEKIKKKLVIFPKGINPFKKYAFCHKSNILIKPFNKISNLLEALKLLGDKDNRSIKIEKDESEERSNKSIFENIISPKIKTRNKKEDISVSEKKVGTFQQYNNMKNNFYHFTVIQINSKKEKNKDDNIMNSSIKTLNPNSFDFKIFMDKDELVGKKPIIKNIFSISELSSNQIMEDIQKNNDIEINPYSDKIKKILESRKNQINNINNHNKKNNRYKTEDSKNNNCEILHKINITNQPANYKKDLNDQTESFSEKKI
jgi:hypothetical protein